MLDKIENLRGHIIISANQFIKLAISLLLGFVPVLAQGNRITNSDVIEMSQAGLSPSIIEAKIASSSCSFDTSTAGLSRLKAAGVNDEIVASMLRCTPSKAPHDKPYIWIGTNEEWTSRSIGSAYAHTYSKNSAVITGVGKTTTESHSEFADITREIRGHCPSIEITNSTSVADYAITVDRHNSGHLLSQRNSYNIFRASDGGLIDSGKTIHLKNAVSDICRAVSGPPQ